MTVLTVPPHVDLEYWTDDEPGIRRRGRKRFRYVDDATGETIRDPDVLARIRSIAVPPAWADVWIAPHPKAHIQATGRDAKGRKQYRYHPEWSAHRNSVKFGQLRTFGHALSDLRAHVDRDLSRRDLSHERVLALVVALLDLTAVRIGGEAYATENGTFGLTTLRNRHAEITSGALRLKFKAKHGKVAEVACTDRRIARVAKRCQELPGQMLFQYVDDDGEVRPVRSAEVNDYLRQIVGEAGGQGPVTAKTFRTWDGSVRAAELLAEVEVPSSDRARRQALGEAVEQVAAGLGNTPTVCRGSYIHPRIIERWELDELGDAWRAGPARAKGGVASSERRLLHLLELDVPRRERRPA